MVSEQCLVKLKIGPITDEVLCDIIQMDHWNILLGRPWKFYRYAIYDGRVKKYTTRKGSVTYTLLPFVEDPNEMSCTIRFFMASGK